MKVTAFLFMLATIQLCYSGNVGTESICSENDTNGQQEATNIIYAPEQDYIPSQRISITMNIADLNLDWFEMEGSMRAGLICARYDYYATKVVYGDDILWTSEDGWECTHVFVNSNSIKMLIVMGFRRGIQTDYKALFRQNGQPWERVSMMDAGRLVFDIEDT
ncbi:hypothetical protein BEWA_047050 [Theileria equi strain WA]|uniref:Signal peptide-containing protein n=1 Tax=Theileria equi strain WA TaxID=1537102 RepID=L1L9R8_THEEQ|nr:hypothetical protein BEWA_047050 [Theileria equi strain WA]EKX72241.1 hypothetical protein BEWA_047050 [Theileria equi strain WA]|eukprot:XP_004831693.1 hypothetical protein BEWA_047050 [Theileria equi strain WA]